MRELREYERLQLTGSFVGVLRARRWLDTNSLRRAAEPPQEMRARQQQRLEFSLRYLRHATSAQFSLDRSERGCGCRLPTETQGPSTSLGMTELWRGTVSGGVGGSIDLARKTGLDSLRRFPLCDAYLRL